MRTALILAAAFLAGCSTHGRRATKPLDCGDFASIRDFKREVRWKVNPTQGVNEKWAVCLCGEERSKMAGMWPERKGEELPAVYPAFPALDPQDKAPGLKKERDFFLKHLPVTKAQAAELVDCTWGQKMGSIPD